MAILVCSYVTQVHTPPVHESFKQRVTVEKKKRRGGAANKNIVVNLFVAGKERIVMEIEQFVNIHVLLYDIQGTVLRVSGSSQLVVGAEMHPLERCGVALSESFDVKKSAEKRFLVENITVLVFVVMEIVVYALFLFKLRPVLVGK